MSLVPQIFTGSSTFPHKTSCPLVVRCTPIQVSLFIDLYANPYIGSSRSARFPSKVDHTDPLGFPRAWIERLPHNFTDPSCFPSPVDLHANPYIGWPRSPRFPTKVDHPDPPSFPQRWIEPLLRDFTDPRCFPRSTVAEKQQQTQQESVENHRPSSPECNTKRLNNMAGLGTKCSKTCPDVLDSCCTESEC